MKMNGKIAYGGHSYMQKMHTLPYFCENITNMQAGCIPALTQQQMITALEVHFYTHMVSDLNSDINR